MEKARIDSELKRMLLARSIDHELVNDLAAAYRGKRMRDGIRDMDMAGMPEEVAERFYDTVGEHADEVRNELHEIIEKTAACGCGCGQACPCMKERVASRFLSEALRDGPGHARLAGQKAASGMRNVSALSAEQKTYMKEVFRALNEEVTKSGVLEGLTTDFSGDVRDEWQSGAKQYKKDGFGRMSPLAGKPHALVTVTFTTIAPERQAIIGKTDIEFLLSKDGETAIVKDDKYGFRGVKTVAPAKLGQEVGEHLARSIGAARRGQEQQERAAEARREQEQQERAAEARREQAEQARLQKRHEEVEALRDKAIRQLKRNFASINRKIKVAIGSLPEADRPRFFGAEITPVTKRSLTVACKVYIGNDPDGPAVTSLGRPRKGDLVEWHQNQQQVRFLGQTAVSFCSLEDAPKVLEQLADRRVAEWVAKVEKVKQEQARQEQAERERARQESAEKDSPQTESDETWSVVVLGREDGYATEVDHYSTKAKAYAAARDLGECYVVKGTQMWNEPLGQVEEHDRDAPSRYFR